MGRRADLLLVDADPLEHVKNTSKVSGVMVNGRCLAAAHLQSRLVAWRNRYQH